MGLQVFWFIAIAFLWPGFFVLEGFDFGVGMLHGVIGKTEEERRVASATIGPLWDGNEVWLIVAGAGMFAAFPGWYATMFSAYNLALVLLLAALIVRGVAFEYRGKRDAARWRRTWDVLPAHCAAGCCWRWQPGPPPPAAASPCSPSPGSYWPGRPSTPASSRFPWRWPR